MKIFWILLSPKCENSPPKKMRLLPVAKFGSFFVAKFG
jgi:hypothetical protein